MKTLPTIFCLTGTLLFVSVEKSFAQPPCPSNSNAYYDYCFGTVKYANGDKYTGEWKEDKAHGQGIYTYANGNKHVGEYEENKANGQGTYTYANGNKHVGGYEDNKANGWGTYTYVNGNQYIGDFKNDERNGQGTLIYNSGGKYAGEWKYDKFNGQGTYIFANGDKYVGQFKDHKANGQGTLTYGNGNQHDGEDKNGKANRQVLYSYADRSVEKRMFEKSNFPHTQKITSNVIAGKFYEPSLKVNFEKGRAVETDDFATALRKWKPLAEQGNANAQSNVGWIYQYVRGSQQDYRTAVKWYRLAAEQGHIDAQNYLGVMYEKGKGVPQDDNIAMTWWKLAADQGSIFAQNNLGWMYDFKEDYKTAVKWYKLAAEQGYALAQFNLGFVYDSKWKDYRTAVRWYKLAAEQGVSRAYERLQEIQKKNPDQKATHLVTATQPLNSSSETQKELERIRKEIAELIKEENKKSKPQQIPKINTSGLGYVVSKSGHVITNENIVSKCRRVTTGNSAQNQVDADVLEVDKENDLALLKVSSWEMVSIETKHLTQKLGIKTVPLVPSGRLRFGDIDLREDVLVSQISKKSLAKQNGQIPDNERLGVKPSKVYKFLSASGLRTKWPKRTTSMSTRDLAKIAKRKTVIVICHQ